MMQATKEYLTICDIEYTAEQDQYKPYLSFFVSIYSSTI